MIKKGLFFSICWALLAFNLYGQNRLYMNPIKFTDRSIQTYGHTCGNTVNNPAQFYLNGSLFTNYEVEFNCCGLYFIKFDYGLLRPGDLMEVRDGCGSIAYSQTVQDDFVYVQIPPGLSHTGNGIGPTESGSPYTRLTTPTQIGQCENLAVNAHVLLNYRIFSQVTNGNTTGPFLINNQPFDPADHTLDNNGQVGVVVTTNPDGSFSTTGNARFDSKAVYSGAVPLSLEYQHNGWNIMGDFRMTIGGMQMIFRNNGVDGPKRGYVGNEIVTFYTVATPNPIYKITYDEGYYRAFINGVEVDQMQRTVLYNASGGTLSATDGLTYLTPVSFTPNQAGNHWISALIDGVRFVRQEISIAAPLSLSASTINVACKGGSNGRITATPTGGKGPYQYALGSGSFGPSGVFMELAAGSYTVRVRDASGCVASQVVNVEENPQLTLSAAATDVLCASEANGSVTLLAGGGVGNYTYALGNGPFGASNQFASLPEGTYTFTVKDDADCQFSIQQAIGFQSKLMAQLGSVVPIRCFGEADGSISIQTVGSIPSGAIRYSLNGGPFVGSPTFSGLSAGDYTITVQDNLCQTSLTTSVQQPGELTASLALGGAVSCFGGSNGSLLATASGGTAGYSYSLDASTFGPEPSWTQLPANSYKAWIKDANGCIRETNVITITQPTELLFSISAKQEVSCFGAATGSITLLASGGAGGYSYQLNGGAGQPSALFAGLVAGDYALLVRDANGCQKTTSTRLSQPTKLTVEASMLQAVSCFGGADGSLQATASGGVSPYRFALADADYAVATLFNGLTATTYQVWVQDQNGCKQSVAASVTQPTALSLSATATAVSCHGLSDGGVRLTASGGAGDYTFARESGSFQPSPDFGGLAASLYTFTARDRNGCLVSREVTMTQPSPLLATASILQNVSCFGGTDASLGVTASGATPAYAYSLDDLTYQAASVFANLAINTYTVWVRDANGCKIQTNTLTITQPTELSLSVSENNAAKCFGASDGSLTLSATGGVGSYQFALGNGAFQTAPTFTNLAVGTYTFRLRDANACLKTLDRAVSQPAQPFTVALASRQDLTCFQNASGRLVVEGSGGTGPYQFSLDNVSFQASTLFSNLAALSYTVYGKDANGCTFSLPGLQLTQPTDILVSLLSKKDVDCEDYQRGEAQVVASGSFGGFTYTLSGTDFRGNAVVPTANTSGLFTQLLAGNYTLRAVDQTGCPKDFPITIIPKSTSIRFDLLTTPPSSCTSSDGQIQIQNLRGGRAPFQYQLSGQPTPGTATSFTNLINGQYIVTVSDSLCSYMQTADLRLPTSLTADYTLSPVSCAVPTAQLRITAVKGGNGGYQWALNGGSFTDSPLYTDLAPGVYQLLLRDSPLSCQTAQGFEIKEQNRADLQLIAKQEVSCFNGSDGQIQVLGTNNLSPFQYALNYGPYTPNNTFSNLSQGSYLLLARNSFGCVDSLRVGITQPSQLTLSYVKKDNDCHDDSSGWLEGTGGGGTLPYQFTITAGVFQAEGRFEGLQAGSYPLGIRDAKGCAVTSTVVLEQPTAVGLTAVYEDTIRCFGEANGRVRLLASGGTPGYTYSVGGGPFGASAQFANLAAGDYVFTVRDSKQCQHIAAPFTLTQPTVARLSLLQQLDPLCYLDQNGRIEVAGSGGNGGYSYALSTGSPQSSGRFEGLAQGVFSIRMTDRRGCTDTLNRIELRWPEALRWTSSTLMPRCFGENNGSLSLDVAGGTPPYAASVGGTFETLASTTYTFTNLAAADYPVSVRDRNGCTSAQAVRLEQPSALDLRLTTRDNDCFDDRTGRIEVVGRNATPPYQYALNEAPFGESGLFQDLKAGDYTVRVRDANGCLIAPSVRLTQPTLVTVLPVYQDTIRCFGEANGAVRVLAGGGTPGYSYSLDGRSYFTDSLFRQLRAGDYTFYVRDSKQCVQQNSLRLTQPEALLLQLLAQADPLCIGDRNGVVRMEARGGNGGYRYQRDNVLLQASGRFEGLSQGQYAFKVLDRKQCEASLPTVQLRWPTALRSSLTTTPPACPSDTNGSYRLDVTGGSPPYTIQEGVTSHSTERVFERERLAAGRYPLLILDRNGCALRQQVQIAAPDTLYPPLMPSTDSLVTCKGQELTMEANNPTQTVRWMYNDSLLSQAQTITVTQPGRYTLTVANSSGCRLSRSVELVHSARALQSDFLMPSQALVGDTVVALDITRPIPDELRWKLPPQAYTVRQTSSSLFFVVGAAGTYTIEMKAITADCDNISRRTLQVFSRANIADTDSTLGFGEFNLIEEVTVFPNPNDGRFGVVVRLAKEAPIAVRLTRVSTGQVVFTHQDQGLQLYRFEVNLRVPSDVYVLSVQSGNSTISRRISIIN